MNIGRGHPESYVTRVTLEARRVFCLKAADRKEAIAALFAHVIGRKRCEFVQRFGHGRAD